MFPGEVIKDNYAWRGKGFVYVPASTTNRVDLGVMAPYPTDDRDEEHPGQVNQYASTAQPQASPPSPEQPGMEVEEEHPGVPLGQATPSQLASA
eukprot:4056811-Prorocentrum_lima.AAC.1